MPSRNPTVAILLETVTVVVAAAAFAFAANQFSPRGLKLARNYFPNPSILSATPPKASPPTNGTTASTDDDSEAEQTDQRIKDKGLQPIARAQMVRLFHDPGYQDGLVIFIDARDPDHYAAAHIPGAYPLDLYHPEKDLAADLTPCQNASQVIVYCTGGECEDAESAALLLRDAGIPNKKLFVYGGGFDDWSAHNLPLEQGARNSGRAPDASK